MAITKKDAAHIWQLLTDAQHVAWVEGWAMGEAGGDKTRNPYPRTDDIEGVMKLYRLLRGIEQVAK